MISLNSSECPTRTAASPPLNCRNAKRSVSRSSTSASLSTASVPVHHSDIVSLKFRSTSMYFSTRRGLSSNSSFSVSSARALMCRPTALPTCVAYHHD